jgi:hypothetical protein
MASIINTIKNIFKPKETTPQIGTIFLKPDEKKYAPEIAKSQGSGITISVPEKNETYSPTTKTFVSAGGGGGSSEGTTGGSSLSSQIPKGNIEQTIDPVGYAEKQAKTLEQQRLDTEFKQKSGGVININRERTYDQFIGENNQRYVRVTEKSIGGLPIERKVYYINPQGRYTLIAESQANVTGLERSQIQKASVKDILKLGDKELIFESDQPLYKTKEGKLATAYGTFDITEDSVIQEEEGRRRVAAEQFISDKGYSPVITEPTESKNILSKIGKELTVL